MKHASNLKKIINKKNLEKNVHQCARGYKPGLKRTTVRTIIHKLKKTGNGDKPSQDALLWVF